MAKVKVICDSCGKEFEKYESKLGKHNFCGRDCYNLFHSKNTPTCTCEECGKIFKGNKYNANKYCSRECYSLAHAIKNKQRECPACHKFFEAKSSEDKYCSWECYNQDRHMPKGENHWNWQGGISLLNDKRDSSQYKEWRQLVYQRDEFKCVKCGSKDKLNAHHKKSWKHYSELRYDVDNGITLCEKCHILLHQELGYNSDENLE